MVLRACGNKDYCKTWKRSCENKDYSMVANFENKQLSSSEFVRMRVVKGKKASADRSKRS
jgi:hypothetical protein